jgi:hypothetical protein
MAMLSKTYEIARRGLATSFAEAETPLTYALRFLNRFINSAGGAEKRRGMEQRGDAVAGAPNLTNVHEYHSADESASDYVSGGGKIYRRDGSAYTMVKEGLTTSAKIRSYQMDKKLVFYDGVLAPIYTDDNGRTFKPLVALIEEGAAGTVTGGTVVASAKGLTDPDITDWPSALVVANDVVFNVTRQAYGVVTAVTSTHISHTAISAAANGAGITTSGEQANGDLYRVLDYIELNVVTTDTVPDNIATTIAGTGTSAIAVSGDKVANWVATEIRKGDVVYNTTRAAMSFVETIATAQITIHPPIAAQTAGDSLTLLKSACPIPKFAHVHFGRVYSIDSRNAKNIIISGPNDPQDYTVDSESLATLTLAIGGMQPTGEPAVCMGSFATFLVVGTSYHVYAFRGTAPADFEIAGLFPQGVVSPDAFVNTGNDLAFVGPDGLLSVSLLVNTNNLQRSNLSEPIRTTLRDLIEAADESEIQCFNYQRRSWLVVKIGARWFVYNYANFVLDDGRLAAGASWSEFSGFLCQQNAYRVNHEFTVIAAGANGRVFEFDASSVYTDAGLVYDTEYQTGWISLDEDPRSGKGSTKMKSGSYVLPSFEVGGQVNYEIEAIGSYDVESIDTVTATAADSGGAIGLGVIGSTTIGGGRTLSQKHSLRWRGEQVRITFRTSDAVGPDVLSSFTIYGNIHGRR